MAENLVNYGVLPLTFADDDGYRQVRQGMTLRLGRSGPLYRVRRAARRVALVRGTFLTRVFPDSA